MDDLWGNAWSDPTASGPSTSKSSSSTPTWTSPNAHLSPPLHEESDAGFAQVPWSSPLTKSSEKDKSWGDSHTMAFGDDPGLPSWGATASGWIASDHAGTEERTNETDSRNDNEELKYTTNAADPDISEQSLDSPDLEAAENRKAASSTAAAQLDDVTTNDFALEDGVGATRSPATAFRVDSPDGFGTFETGGMEVHAPDWGSAAPFSSAASVPNDDSGWGGDWGQSHALVPTNHDIPSDDWGAAQQDAAGREERVPAQLLDSLLAEWAELSVLMFSNAEKSPDLAACDSDDWEGGMEKVDGLAELIERVAPKEMNLSPTVPINSTTIIKNMQAHVKLTRHVPLSKVSPMSQLLASKGSTAWETYVKARIDPVVDDWAWMGGKPKDLDQLAPPPEPVPEKKPGGILASFWSRRTSTPVQSPPSPQANDDQSKPASPKPKVESPILGSKPASPVVTSPPISLPEIRKSTDISTISSRPGTPSAGMSTNSSVITDPGTPATEATAPSAVSRFLGRFRNRSNNASTSSLPNPRAAHAVSLSESDFSFLEDVPTIPSDDSISSGPDQFKALESMLASKPANRASVPVPLIAPPVIRPQSLSKGASPVTSSPTTNAEDDVWAIFEKPKPPTASLVATQVAPRVPSIPLARMINPSSAGSSRSSTPAIAPLAPPPRVPAPTSRSATPLGLSPVSQTNTSSFSHPPSQPSTLHNTVKSTDFGDFDSAFLPAAPSPGGLTASPATPHPRPVLSPLLTSATPTSANASRFATPINVVGPDDADESFGDFMASDAEVNGSSSQLSNPWPSERQATLGMPSPRISAPDTPMFVPDANKPLPPPRRSLSPLMNKIAKVQSEKWPMPDHAPIGSSNATAAPALAPPPAFKIQRPTQGDLLESGPTSPPVVSSNGSGPSFNGFSFPPPPASNAPKLSAPTSSVFALMQQTSPPPALNSFSLPQPPSRPASISSLPATQLLKPAQVPTSGAAASGGKLSAADLSFFEGL